MSCDQVVGSSPSFLLDTYWFWSFQREWVFVCPGIKGTKKETSLSRRAYILLIWSSWFNSWHSNYYKEKLENLAESNSLMVILPHWVYNLDVAYLPLAQQFSLGACLLLDKPGGCSAIPHVSLALCLTSDLKSQEGPEASCPRFMEGAIFLLHSLLSSQLCSLSLLWLHLVPHSILGWEFIPSLWSSQDWPSCLFCIGIDSALHWGYTKRGLEYCLRSSRSLQPIPAPASSCPVPFDALSCLVLLPQGNPLTFHWFASCCLDHDFLP